MTTPVVTDGNIKVGKKRPADMTGRLSEQLNEQRKAEKAEAAARIAMVTAVEAAAKNEVVDYTSGPPIQQAELKSVEVNEPYRMIRVNSDIDQMTFGREVLDPGDLEANPPRAPIMGPMRYYTFKEGQVYKVPKEVADHLNNIGYLSYMGGA